MITTITDLKNEHERAGGHFFTPGAMRFFNSRILSDLYPVDETTGYFVTSEKFEDAPREYTVRKYQGTHISTIETFPTAYQAKKFAKTVAA